MKVSEGSSTVTCRSRLAVTPWTIPFSTHLTPVVVSIKFRREVLSFPTLKDFRLTQPINRGRGMMIIKVPLSPVTSHRASQIHTSVTRLRFPRKNVRSRGTVSSVLGSGSGVQTTFPLRVTSGHRRRKPRTRVEKRLGTGRETPVGPRGPNLFFQRPVSRKVMSQFLVDRSRGLP